MAITKVTLAKEHDDGVEYLYPKTSSDIVTHKNKHGDETNINNFLSDINNIPGVLDIENGGTSATTGPNAIHNLTNGKIEVNENNKVVINANVNISGTTTSGEKLTVSNGGADINGKLTVTGGDIEATGNNIKGNTLQSVNGTTVGNKLTVSTGGASINGNLTVTNGNANISGTTTSGGKLTVNRGGADITGNTIISGNLTSHGALSIEDGYGATIDGDVTISGTTTSGGKLTVTNGGADINGNISFHNPVTLDDKLTITNNGLEVQNSGDIITNGGAIKGFSMDITSRADVGELVVKRGIGIENNGMSIRNGGGASIDGHLTVTNGTINGAIPYGSCSTAAATAAKTVTVNGTYSLVTGARVVVKFTVTNTTENPTLNVNSTGAKAIYYRGYAISAGALAANRTYEFVYNGTQYELVGDIDTNTDSQEIYVGPSNAPVNASIEDPMVVLSTNNGTYITAFKLKGSKATTVSSDSKKNITISSTDTKVTSVENHYAPVTDPNSKIEVDAKNATNAATWNNTNLVTGVNLQRDSKGHVTGMTLDSIKMPTNPNTDTSTTLDGHYTPSANSNSKIEVDAKNATEAATWNVTNLVTGVNLQRDSKGHVTGMTLDSIKMPTNPNTHCTTHLYAGSGSAANATTTDGSTKLTIADNDTVRNSIILKGKGATTVTSDDNGVITINSIDTQPAAQSSYSIDASGDSTSPSGARIKLQKNNVDSSSVKIYGSGTSSVSKDDTGIKINTPLTINIDAYEKQEDEDGEDPIFDGIANAHPDNLSVFSSGVNYRTTFTFTGTSSTKKIYRKKYVNNKYVWQNVSDSSDTVAFASNNGSSTPLTNNTITITPNMLGTCLRGHKHGLASTTENGFMPKGDRFILSENIHQGRDLTLNDDGGTYKNAIGANSIVIGGTATNIATQTNSCAIGCSNTVKSCDSYVIGHDNSTSKGESYNHNYIFGAGNSVSSSSNYLTIIGTHNKCGCERSFIFGDNSTITARSGGSVAIGCNSTVTGSSTAECSPECVAIAGGKIDIKSANVISVHVYKKGTKTIYNDETATMAGHSLSYGMFSRTFSPHAVSFGTGCFAGDIGSFVCGMAPETGYNSAGGYDSTKFSGISRRQTVYGLEAGVDTNVFVVGNGNYVTDEGANGTTHPVVYDEDNKVYIHTFNHSNVLRVTYRGGIYANGQYHSNGADYAEFIKEWWDGNPDNEDRVGYMVTIGEDNKLHKANEGDYIIGITSGNPSVIGNADEEYFWKYEKDRFNRIVMEETPVKIQEEQSDGSMVEKEIMISNKKFSANYDKDKPYIQRANRPEWDYVGMRGIVPCRDDGTCIARGFCRCGANGIATKADTRGYDTYYVIERIDDETISVEVR